MAVIKHISVKGSNGGDALNYVLYKHNEKTGELIVDGRGNPVMRDEYYLDGINCEPYSFAAECKEVNDLYGKNQLPGDIKAHHFIISYDPRDGIDHGLTGPKAQQLSMEWAERSLPGFQILLCTHMDGSNESGNIHTHIMMNSVRKNDTDPMAFGEREIDHRAGYKLHLTEDYLQHMKRELMAICEREGLYQVNLLSPAENHVTDKEYRVHQHGQVHIDNLNKKLEQDGKELIQTPFQTQKQYVRDAVKNVASRATTFDSFCGIMKEEYNITVKERRGRISYLHPEREKYITGKALGKDYEIDEVLKMISGEKTTHYDTHSRLAFFPGDVSLRIETMEDCRKVFVMHSDLKLVVRVQECAKAQMSATYANKVIMANVKAMAETILFIQQKGFNTVEDMRDAWSTAARECMRINNEILQEKKMLKSINADIQNVGQYLTYKKVYAEYMKTDKKREFALEHRNELGIYKDAVSAIRKKYKRDEFPMMNDLRGEKRKIENKIKKLEASKPVMHKQKRIIEEAAKNIEIILDEKIMQKHLTNDNTYKKDSQRIPER